jgi:hypothetical protein
MRKTQPNRVTNRKPFKILSVNDDLNLRNVRLLPGESARVVILDNLTPMELLPTQNEAALDHRGFTGFFRITSTDSGNFDVDLSTTVIAPRPTSFEKIAYNGEPPWFCSVEKFTLLTWIRWKSSTGYLMDLKDGQIAESLSFQGLVSQPPCDPSNGETDGRLPLPFSEPSCYHATPKRGQMIWFGNERAASCILAPQVESGLAIDGHQAFPNGYTAAPYKSATYSIMQDYYWYFAGLRLDDMGRDTYSPIKVSPRTYEIKRSITANKRSERAADPFEPKHWRYTVSCLGASNSQSPPPPQ